jgi:adenosylcobinamide-phosphate synthase
MALEYQILIALLLDFALGDPRWVPHPVRLIGKFAEFLERVIRPRFSKAKTAGTVCALMVIGATGLAALGILTLAESIDPKFGLVVSIIMIYFGVAAKDMIKHASAVYTALKQGSLERAREKVGMICGRDPQSLDEPAIIRATVESVAENTVDGVIAPLLFAFLGGPVGILMYKAVSTLDSTFGYKNDRYIDFGRASAKLDDVANFVPARITGLIMSFAGLLLCGNFWRPLKIFLRDRKNHPSPNSAHGEAAMAGVLGIQLGGLSYYGGKPYEKPLIGDDLFAPTPEHILLANGILALTAIGAVGAFSAVSLLIR